MRGFNLRSGLLLLGGLILLATSNPAHAQTLRGIGRLQQDPDEESASAARALRVERAAGGTFALEGAVDADAYLVGPGDVFSVSIGGAQPVVYTAMVTPDGYLVFPDAGGVPVAGESLLAARRRAQAALATHYRNVPIDLALMQPRRFAVHVTGAVPNAGRAYASATERVSDVVTRVFDTPRQAAVTNQEYEPSLRDILVRHRDGTEQHVDLVRYKATGEVDLNPYLQDGDVISIPAYRTRFDVVFVNGAVPFPDTYAYRPGDRVLDLLAISGGRQLIEEGGTVRLQRRGTSEPMLLDIQAMASGTAENVPIQPLDGIFVISSNDLRGTADVIGPVKYPGTYPIVEGESTLKELVLRQAGGLLPGARMQGALLLRGRNTDWRQARADTTALSRTASGADLPLLSRIYLQNQLRLSDVVPVDLSDALQSGGAPVYLHDGDRLLIQTDDRSVYVFGQVARPGYVPYVAGGSAASYLAQAGGATEAATERWVVKAGSNRLLPLEGASIESGDAIFIDRSPMAETLPARQLEIQENQLDLQRRQLRSDNRSRFIQTALQTVSLVASTITTIIVLQR